MDEDQQNLIRAIKDLTDKMDDLSASILGRSGGKKSQVPRSAASTQTPAQKEAEKIQKDSNKRAREGLNYVKKEDKARQEITGTINDEKKARQEDTRELEKATRAQKEMRDGFMSFGKGLFKDNANLSSSFESLGSNLKYAGSSTGKFLGGIATGVGYALGALQGFADSAKDMGAFADLSKFSVGSVAQMKLMSGLGAAFTKVIEESQGRFRAYGKTSEEAAENLSNLSRSLKLGSFYLNSTLGNTLGTKLKGRIDEASKGAAAMGLADEERAKLLGQLSRSASYGAKTEQDAQRNLVTQYADTIKNTRTLSNTFGVSAKAILKAMEDFRNTTAGAIADISGNTGAQNIMAGILEAGITKDQEAASRIALALSKGNVGLAMSDLAKAGGTGAEQEYLLKYAEALQGTDGGKNADALRKNLEANRGEMKEIYDRQSAAFEAGARDQYKNVGQFGRFVENLGKSAQAEGEKEPTGSSEADNIKSMDRLTGALNSLRNVLLGITATVALLGTGVTMLAAGAAGGMLAKGGSGALGKIKDLFSSYKSANQGPQLPGKAKGGIFERIFGSAGDVAKAQKTSSSIGSMLRDLGKGIQSFLAGTGKGIGLAFEGVMRGLANGIMAFGNPLILKGAAILSAAAAILGAGVAASMALIGLALKPFAAGLQELDKVKGDNFLKIGAGLIAISAGLGVFSVALAGSLAVGIGEKLLSLFGVKSPLEKLKDLTAYSDRFRELGVNIKSVVESIKAFSSIDGENIFKIGEGLSSVGSGLFAMSLGMAASSTIGAVSGVLTNIASFFGVKSPFERITELVPIADKISLLGLGIKNFGEGLGNIGSNLADLDLEKFGKFKDILVELSNIDMPAVNALLGPGVQTNITNGIPAGGTFADALNNPAITPDVIAQVMAYLENIENDLQAIRGNTRNSGYDVPVKLA